MINVHRLKKVNADKVMSALKDRGISAKVVKAPLSLLAFEMADGWYGSEATRQIIKDDTENMVGIECDLSGQKFHKILVELGIVKK